MKAKRIKPMRIICISRQNARRIDNVSQPNIKAVVHCGEQAYENKHLVRYYSEEAMEEQRQFGFATAEAYKVLTNTAERLFKQAGKPEDTKEYMDCIKKTRDEILALRDAMEKKGDEQ